MENLLLLATDDLRQSALAIGGIEAFLVQVQQLLESPQTTSREVAAVLDTDLDHRVQELDDALSALRRSMVVLRARL